MIRCKNVKELSKYIKKEKQTIDIDKIASINYPFLEASDNFTLISVPSYHENKNNIIFIGKEVYLLSSENFENIEDKHKGLVNQKYVESTIYIYLVLRAVLKNYAREFDRIRYSMDQLDAEPAIEKIELMGRDLREFVDRMESFVHVILRLKEREIKSFDSKIIPFDYEILHTESRYWLERARSHNYRIASLRSKSEMKSNAELNKTMKKLTVIMTFLSIVAIVVNVPGTIGAIFGIPALSNAYFESHTLGLVITLIITTLLSVLLGLIYWSTLGLDKTKV